MPNVTEFLALIADDLDRSDMGDTARTSLFRNISFYQPKRFWFNVNVATDYAVAADANEIDLDEAYNNTITTTIDKPSYFSIDAVEEIVSGDENRLLTECQYTEIDPDAIANTGKPNNYARLPDKVVLDKYYSSAATYRVKGHKRLNAPTDDTTDNDWLMHAEELLRTKVLLDIYAFKLHNAEMALLFKKINLGEMESLIVDTARFQGTGRITPTQF